MSDQPTRRWRVSWAVLVAAAIPVLLAARGLTRQDIDGLDQAHHLMGGMFFADFYRDLPLADPIGYVYRYYRQYPALGFTIWPPLFNAAEGVVMLFGGTNVTAGRVTLLLFSIVLAATLHLSLRRTLGDRLSLLAVAVTLTQPLLFGLQNSLMLEVPAMAMISLLTACYLRLVARGHWNGLLEALLLALLGAATVYAKQTAVFFLPALFLDMALNHRTLLKSRWTLVAMVLLVLFCVPLAAMTVKFGAINLAQSIGSQGNIYVSGHRVAERWSVAGWTYYAHTMCETLHPLMVGLMLVGLAVGLLNPQARKHHGVWFAGLICWYLVFSYFDNKQPRFLVFGIPFIFGTGILGTYTLARERRWGTPVLAALLALVTALQCAADWNQIPSGYTGMAEILRQASGTGPARNLAYFGDHRQAFVPILRMQDPNRERFMLQGDDIAADSSLTDACRDYQVGWLLVETSSRDGETVLMELRHASPEVFRIELQTRICEANREYPVIIYSYHGPVAKQMKSIPLQSIKQRISAQP